MQLTSRNEAGVKAVLLNGRDRLAPAAKGLGRRPPGTASLLKGRRSGSALGSSLLLHSLVYAR